MLAHVPNSERRLDCGMHEAARRARRKTRVLYILERVSILTLSELALRFREQHSRRPGPGERRGFRVARAGLCFVKTLNSN
jgi:hypothetical protein